MSYLLDSHIVLWFRERRLPKDVLEMLEDPTNDAFYSVVTPWELSIKQAKGRLTLPDSFFPNLPKLGFACLPVQESHTDMLRQLPLIHHDPFDRMLIAQAKAERLTLITADKALAAYPIKTLLVEL